MNNPAWKWNPNSQQWETPDETPDDNFRNAALRTAAGLVIFLALLAKDVEPTLNLPESAFYGCAFALIGVPLISPFTKKD